MRVKNQELKKDFVLVLLPTKTKNQIRILSRQEGRSLSNYCLEAIKEKIGEQKNGEKVS